MKSKAIGIIGEDDSDIEVIKAIISKYLPPSAFHVSRFIGHGCGVIRRKTEGWARVLWRKDCRFLILLHDADSTDESTLRVELEAIVAKTEFSRFVVAIPVREVEAWLLSDPAAIQAAMGLPKPLIIKGNTEVLQDPKTFLRRLVWKAGKKRYLHTVHNKRIAARAKLSSLRRCNSFSKLDQFMKNHLMD